MLPMGIRRVEHKDEAVTMTTAADIEAQDHGIEGEDSDSEGMFIDSDGTKAEDGAPGTPDDGEWEHAVPKPRGAVRIKDEPTDGDAMDIDDLPKGGFKAPDSPELKKKGLVGSDDKKKKKKTAAKDLEEEITTQDLERMVEMFTLGEQDGRNNELEGHMFLFQFPPVLPTLKVVSTESAPTLVKPDPDDEDELFVSNVPPKTTAKIDLTKESESKVKTEEDAEESDKEEEHEENKQGGFVGQLVVRKSGKVELSWGGKTLLMVPGTQSNFFSQAVLLEDGDVKPGQVTDVSGTAFGMGRIQGSFALAPTWEEEEDWDVDPEDLMIPE